MQYLLEELTVRIPPAAKRALRNRQLASRGRMAECWLDDRLLESEPFKREVSVSC